ncbi:alpha/beta hydrolase family protein [Gallaecimonas pentaromativorans]|uniref:Dipeptidyl aminopeptidase/acylaminoacyl peptidase n=1 Tax=Gallaecimonas pentaromativorans TaxID=584787 RepID=A0A3N1NTS0_9GAMM|nr:S9 family peptidase [Gallaecimonas pentaromativorans]ROQ18841.1 dipeptidyl aminopeptidase/acylaminoacyl peptidase [Gallaecimonas pentaromativorans]
MDLFRLLLPVLACLASASVTPAVATSLDNELINQLSARSPLQEAKISPSGDYLAFAVVDNDERTIKVVATKDMHFVGGVRLGGTKEFGSFYWANDERIVAKVVEKLGWQEEPVYYGELFAFNRDGKKGKMIYGYSAGEKQTGSHIKRTQSTYGWASFIDALPNDSQHILIGSQLMSSDQGTFAQVMKLDIYRGLERSMNLMAPVPDAEFLLRPDQSIGAAYGSDKNAKSQVYLHQEGKEPWKPLATGDITPLGFDNSGKGLYVLRGDDGGPLGLYKYELDQGNYKKLYVDPVSSVTNVLTSLNDHLVYGLEVEDGLPSYLIINGQHQEAKTFKDLLATFPGTELTITSSTPDGSQYVLLTETDTDPGSLYLFDQKKRSVTQLFSFYATLDRKALMPSEPFSFKASDGLMLHGYYTPPRPDRAGKHHKLVVLVHGGPHGVRDHWAFDRDVHILSQHGYAVLRVNYRGSGGYGAAFVEAGYRHWGDLIQRDIAEAVDWAIREKDIAKDKVCIMGGSFGGYSAVMSAIIYPDKYRCAVANAGVYDLPLMKEEGDVPEYYNGEAYLDQALGEDEAQLLAMSPAAQVGRLKVPLLLTHGTQDKRAPIEQYEALATALKAAHKPFESLVLDKEGHGFRDPEHRALYYRTVLNFLGQQLGD